MRTLTTQQINDRYATLSKSISDVVRSGDINLKLYKIATSEGVGKEDAIVFINLAHLLLVKLIPPNEASEFIATTLELPLPLANSITRLVYSEIVSAYQADFDALPTVGTVTNDSTEPEANAPAVSVPATPVASEPVGLSAGSWREAITKNLPQ